MTFKHILATALTWLAAFLIVPLPLVLLLNQNLVDTPINLLAIDLSLFAYVWWLIIVYLAMRPKWLEKYLGLPSIYFLHAILGVMAIIAAFLHQNTLFSMHPLIKRTGLLAFYLAIFLLLYAVIFLSGWLVDRLPFMREFKEKCKNSLSHQVTLWLHRLNFLVIALIFIHVHLIPRINCLSQFMLFFDLYTLAALAAYAYKKLIADYSEQKAIVVESRHLNPHLLQIKLKAKTGIFTCQAGDFYWMTVVNNSRLSKEAHPFSVAWNSKHGQEITVQIDQVGDYTKKLDLLKKGNLIRLEGPYGLFAQEIEHFTGPLVFYALGSGIAPLLNLAPKYGPNKEIHLIWSRGTVTEPVD